MTTALETKIRGLAAPAKGTEEQIVAILQGWDELFARLGVEPEGQEAEFDAIMRVRLRAGVISIVPDRFIGSRAEPTQIGIQ
jgi:hypothetical protein